MKERICTALDGSQSVENVVTRLIILLKEMKSELPF